MTPESLYQPPDARTGTQPSTAAAPPERLTSRARREGWVRAGELAKSWGLTPKTIGNYARDGMPVAGEDARGRWFSPGDCRAWADANQATGHGGRRAGAGRKSAEHRALESGDEAVGMRRQYKAAETAATVRSRIDADERPPGAMTVSDTLNLTRDELQTLVELYPDVHEALSKTKLDRMRALIEAQLKGIQLAKESGRLVDAEEAAAAFGERLSAARRSIDDLAGRLAAKVAQELEASGSLAESVSQAAAQAVVRAAVDHEADRVLRTLAEE